MNTLDFARKHIRFTKAATPITGPFRDEMYPFVRKPFAAADDISCKRLIIFKASGALGSVCGEIINTKRIRCDVGDQIIVCQTQEKAETWSKTRGKDWLQAIPDIARLISTAKYAVTNSLWQFRHKDMLIYGPGINNAQSDQARYLQTDESHLEAFEPGSLVEWEKRIASKWHRQATHITTAPDVGKEVDQFYTEGQQDEWHFRCPKCTMLFWPLWGHDSEERYGKQIFLDNNNETACACPWCDDIYQDTSRDRYSLVRDGDYVAMNPTAAPETRSFRWNVFAAHWISWREIWIESQAANAQAREFGNLKPLEDFTKKRLCMAWRAILPQFGDNKGEFNYKLGDVWQVEDSIRIISADYQAGKGSEGAHIHAHITQFDRNGNSRRICYRRLDTFAQLHQIAVEFGVQEMIMTNGKVHKRSHVIVDSGFNNREVFRACAIYGWYAFRGSDIEQFHSENGKTFSMPYSHAEPQSGIVGEKSPKRLSGVRAEVLPPGWAFCIVGHKPTLCGALLALVGGSSGRYFGIATDFPDCYKENMPAYVAVIEADKKTNTVKKVIYRKVREAHWHHCEEMALVIAMRSGYFPLAKPHTQTLCETKSAQLATS